jgi:hypothetical protein
MAGAVLGIPLVSPIESPAFEQGRFLESSIGHASMALQTKSLDVTEKINAYLDLNRVAISAKLPDAPRAIKLSADSVHLLQVVQTYLKDAQGLTAALQADVALLAATERAMLTMVQTNINALANLLSQICNFGLPKLPSLSALLNMFHWNGFHFTFDFSLKALSSGFSLPNFSFSQCSVSTPNLAPLFSSASSIPVGALTASIGSFSVPLSGTIAPVDMLDDPAFIATMQDTTTAVYNPTTVQQTSSSSLPDPSTIISNYSLPPATYIANIVSIIPALQSVVLQPGQTATTGTGLQLQALLAEYVNLSAIVASNYDANLIAAWLIYLDLNRQGRSGTWLADYETLYTTVITPSVSYINSTPVPWNEVLGGTGIVADEPVGIPLQALLQANTTGHLLWELSFLEAGLLGYVRNTTWDVAGDNSLTAPDTGTDLDYAASTISTTSVTLVLGQGTAAVPSEIVVPTSIVATVNQALQIAAIAIQAAPSFLSNRPQYRYTYDMFGNATLVDRFTQYWREYAGNFQVLLTGDAFTEAFAIHYSAIVDAAVSPLAKTPYYTNLQADTATRSRTWTPGSVLPAIPTALENVSVSSPPTDATNGWTSGTLNAAAYLARPDVQAQPLPTQVAMLRTNQSYAALMTLQNSIMTAVASATATALNALAGATLPGWQVETTTAIPLPPGATPITLSFLTIDSDQTNFVTSGSVITIQNTGAYALTISLNLDSTLGAGVSTAMLLQNGTVIATASTDTINQPFAIQLATIAALNVGDTLSVQVVTALAAAQSILAGSTFLGLLDQNATSQDTQVTAAQGSASLDAANTFTADVAFPAFTAVAIGSDGNVSPVNPVVSDVIPLIDGIALTASTGSGSQVTVATAYGAFVYTPTLTLPVGSLLYVGLLGELVSEVPSGVVWLAVAGRALSATSFLFEPHLPTII